MTPAFVLLTYSRLVTGYDGRMCLLVDARDPRERKAGVCSSGSESSFRPFLSLALCRLNDALWVLEHGTNLTVIVRACVFLGEAGFHPPGGGQGTPEIRILWQWSNRILCFALEYRNLYPVTSMYNSMYTWNRRAVATSEPDTSPIACRQQAICYRRGSGAEIDFSCFFIVGRSVTPVLRVRLLYLKRSVFLAADATPSNSSFSFPHLELTSRYSQICCKVMAESRCPGVLYDFIQSLNRSPPHQSILKWVF